jgi:tRNA U34 5-methylaminomethyl-2-thiouridine-forming methyltransferase MnmC
MNIEQTADGSYTLYVPELDEHYHSVKGALTESQHIFIDMGLKHSPVPSPRILEIGLGTGLNCFLTLLAAEETERHIHYTGIERYPLSEEIVRQLDYPSIIDRGHADEYFAIHQSAWEKDTKLSPWFTLRKLEAISQTIPLKRGMTSSISMLLLPKNNRRCGINLCSTVYTIS